MTNAPHTRACRYKAFISYSHAADSRLAPALRTALHGFAKPWHRLRAMRVFRDETGLAVTPALWPSIEAALVDSEYFLLLASPDAAASEWVQREVACWLERRPADHMLIVLTRGEITWNDAERDFDWSTTDALPRRVSKVFDQEPRFVDLRWASKATDLSLRNPDFLNAVATVAATLLGRPLDELVGEDVRHHRRGRRLTAAAITALAVLALVATVGGVVAVQQRNEARRQEEIARRQLVQLNRASGSRAADAGDASAALLWFAEAARREEGHPIEQGLLRTRLASLVRRHPRLAQVWSLDVPVGGVRFSADGSLVVVYPSDTAFEELEAAARSVHAWDAQSGSAAVKPPAAGGPVLDVAVTPQGGRFLTVDGDTARVWDVRTGERVLSLAHGAPVSLAEFGAGGLLVLTVGRDETARVWDSRTGRAIAALDDVDVVLDAVLAEEAVSLLILTPGNEAARWESRDGSRVTFDDPKVQSAEFSADRQHVLTFDNDSSAAVWDSRTGRQVSSLGDWMWVDHARFSPDGQRVAMVSRNGWARVWDVAADREVQMVQHQGAVLDAAFSPDGKWLATASTDERARIWDIETGKEVTPPLWHETTVSRVAFGPDGKRLATTTADDVVRLWDIEGEPGVSMPHEESVRFAAFSPDGTRVLTATDFTAQLWDVTGTAARTTWVLRPGLQVYHATFSPDGAYALTASADGTALWEVETGNQATVLPEPYRVRYAAFTRDGKTLVTASDRRLSLWDVGKPSQVARQSKISLAHDAPITHAEFAASGREILAVDFGRTVRMWTVDTAQERSELRHSETTHATLSPDGRRMATAGEDRVVHVWDTATGAQVGQIVQHEYRMTALAFSPDGRRMVTASENVVRVWDAESGNAVTPPMQHGGRVLHAVFSPDSTRVLTASADRTARVWNAATGDPVTDPLEHGGVVRHAAFSPEGRRVVTASEDRTARVWDVSQGGLSTDEWARRAQLLASRRIDDTGAVVTLDRERFLDLWRTRPAP